MPSYDPSLFNVDPYYDDFNEDKKFLRLMFRPGYGVQARELTQLQTMLQNQVERLGSHIFEEGSIVLDGQISENRLKYARISTNTSEPNDFIGVVMGRSGRSSARIVHAERGLGVTSDNNPVLFFEYIEGGTGFQYNDIIAGTAANGAGITATVTGPSVFANPVGNGIVVSVDRGVRFVEGYFVLNTAQSIGAYSLSGSGASLVRIYDNPTTRVGFNVSKEFVSASDDESLNDPAFGYYNYAAPGSDRFLIDLGLTQHGYTASDTSAVDNFSRVGFVEFMRIVDGDIIKVEKYPDYAMLEDTLARRTYDESGNYTVTPFDIELKGPTTANGNAVLKAELSAGKAYVFGYEFETQAKTKLNIPCARGSAHERQITRDFIRYVGPNTMVQFSGISGSVGSSTDFNNHPLAFLSSGESGTTYSQIGTARIRGMIPFSIPTGVYELGLYDIYLSGTASFDSVRRIFIGQTASHAFTLTGANGLEDEAQSSLLYRVPEGSGVKSFNSGDFAIMAHNKQTVSGALPYTFTITESGSSNLAILYPTLNEITIPNADLVVFDQDGNICGGTAARGANNQQVSVTVTSGTTAGKELHIMSSREPINDIQAMLTNGGGFVRSKSKVTENITLTGAFGSLTGDGRGTTSDTLYLNGNVDVLEVLALTGTVGASANVSLLSYLTFDNGQRDAFYDWSRFTLIDGVTGVTGPYTATITRYSRTGLSLGFFTVASYPSYEDIPTYTSRTTGEVYPLRDCLDFRPDRSTNGDTQSRTFIPTNTAANDNVYNYTHYLPRTDKIVLTRDRQFAVISGIPSLAADIPPDDPNAMSLYTVRVNPYTFTSDDGSARLIENKRYTMRDIGSLERRIEAVEQYATMNLLEQDAKAKSILDDQGIEMPKKGILVDQFKGHAIADNEDPMFAASVDEVNSEIRPAIDTRSYNMEISAVSNTVTGNASDGIYTLTYTQSPEILNLLASGWQKINPFSVINYMGTMSINPSTDTWFNDKADVKVRVNVEGENDNFVIRDGRVLFICPGCPQDAEYARKRREEFRRRTWGASYNSWDTRWFGVQDPNEKNSRPNIERSKPIAALPTGINGNNLWSSATPESMKKVANGKTVRKDVMPKAREKQIAISAKGLKPNTAFRVYCDDMDVTPFCLGTSLLTDSRGEIGSGLTFYFNAPSLASLGVTSAYSGPEQDFLAGKHVIRISDSSTPETSTMAAEAVYTVEGNYAAVDSGILSTRQATIRRKSVKSEKVVSNLNEILTSSGEIKGYAEPLAQTIYVDPTKYPSGVFVKSVDLYFRSKDTSTSVPVIVQIRPTLSGYPHPSKVLPFATAVAYSDSINVNGSGDWIVSGSSNNTNFSFSSPVYLLPGEEYAISVSTNSPNYELYTGEIGTTVLRASEEADKIQVSKQPLVRSLFKPQNTGKMLKSDNESLAFRLNLCKFSTTGTLTFRNSAITDETDTLTLNEFRVNTAEVIPEGTTILYTGTFGGIVYSNPITTNKNIIAKDGSRTVASSLNAGAVGVATATLTNASGGYVSPVFDIHRTSMLTVTNVINNNNVTAPGDGQYNGELESTNAGSNFKSAARYISKRVTLEEGMEAENLTVMLSLCNFKGNSYTQIPTIKVFVRPVPIGEPDIENVGYTELTASSGGGESTSDTDFREITYTNIGSQTLPKFRTFSIKVVMFGNTNGSAVPRIRNLRIVAT